VNFAEYRAIDAMNWSTLKHGGKSLMHLRHELDSDDDGDTTNRTMLRLNHAAVLEPASLASEFAVFDGERRAGKEWEAFKLANAGRQIVKAGEMAAALRVAEAVRSHRAASEALRGARCEDTIVWTDLETGIQCKARLDVYAPKRHIADLKGDASVDEFAFARRVGSNLYYAQLAWYQMGVEAATGDRVPCLLIPYETEEPHDVAVFEVSDDWLQPGHDLCRRLLREYAQAKRDGLWPGRYDGIRPLPAPPKWINPNTDDYAVDALED